nr:MAG TPA: hypothetical protein [Caudoviricetes sp.]
MAQSCNFWMIKITNWSVKLSYITQHMTFIWCKLKLTVIFGIYRLNVLLNNGVKHMNTIKALFVTLLAIAVVTLSIVAKLSWLAVGIAFVLALIGIAGVTMAVTATVFWFAVKITIVCLICVLVAALVKMGE